LDDLTSRQEQARRYQRQRQQGLGRPIISQLTPKGRIVAVGNKAYCSPRYTTFIDFLSHFIIEVIGMEWFLVEDKKPEAAQHPLFRLHLEAAAQLKAQQFGDGHVRHAETTGAIEAYYRLAYHLYLLSHNGGLPDVLLARLKWKDQFRGAEHELYVAATFIKAGFTVEFEDESDSSRSHCEYTVTHLKTGQKFSVEAKARGVETTLVRGLLTNALRKQADHTRLIWFAINWPTTDGDAGRAALFETLTELRSREDILIDGKPAPPAYVIVSNNPYEHAFDSAKYSVSALAEGFQVPDMKYDQQFRSVREMRLNRTKHQPIHDLMQSIQLHHRIPVTFDGEDEAFAFVSDRPRLLVGSVYEIPDGQKTVQATLESGLVLLPQKEIHGFYWTSDGRRLMASCPITDAEVRAYVRMPETFFGVLDLNAESKARDPLEIFDWMYDSYSKTPKEKLLEFLGPVGGEASFQAMSQQELAILYCEHFADSMHQRQISHEQNQSTGGKSDDRK
jgi:hypothetical protein